MPVLSPRVMVHLVGVGLLVTTAVCGMDRLRPPTPRLAAQLESPSGLPLAVTPDDTARTVAGWLAPGPLRMNVRVTGLVLSGRGHRAVALLSVDEQPARPFVVGESLPGGAVVSRIEADSVLLTRPEGQNRLPAPSLVSVAPVVPVVPVSPVAPVMGRDHKP